MSIKEEVIISEGILSQINSIGEDNYTIKAFNNDHTPFQLVYMVLLKVIPMNEDQAYNSTIAIHEKGEAIIYTGNKSHCQKIGNALDAIKVKYEIF